MLTRMGLQEAEKTLNSTVSARPGRRSAPPDASACARQLGLIYFVDDGILVITSEDSEQTATAPSRVEPSPFSAEEGQGRAW